jgi:hypothetical protein
MVCRSQDVDGRQALGVVHERWDVYHGTQYGPLSPREQVPEGRLIARALLLIVEGATVEDRYKEIRL